MKRRNVCKDQGRISRSGKEAGKAGMQELRGSEVPGEEGQGGRGQITSTFYVLVRS